MIHCAFDRGEECAALKKKTCEGCRFRKSKKRLIEGRKKAEVRVQKLPDRQKKHIYDKYYAGIKPSWMNADDD